MVSVCLKRGYQYVDAIKSRYKNPRARYIDVPLPLSQNLSPTRSSAAHKASQTSKPLKILFVPSIIEFPEHIFVIGQIRSQVGPAGQISYFSLLRFHAQCTATTMGSSKANRISHEQGKHVTKANRLYDCLFAMLKEEWLVVGKA